MATRTLTPEQDLADVILRALDEGDESVAKVAGPPVQLDLGEDAGSSRSTSRPDLEMEGRCKT